MTGIFEHSGNPVLALHYVPPPQSSCYNAPIREPWMARILYWPVCWISEWVFSDVFIMALLKALLMWRMQRRHADPFPGLCRPHREAQAASECTFLKRETTTAAVLSLLISFLKPLEMGFRCCVSIIDVELRRAAPHCFLHEIFRLIYKLWMIERGVLPRSEWAASLWLSFR